MSSEGTWTQERSWLRRISPVLAPTLAIVVSVAGLTFTYTKIIFEGPPKRVSALEDFKSHLRGRLEAQDFSDENVRIAFNHYDRVSGGALSRLGPVAAMEDFVVSWQRTPVQNPDGDKANLEPVMAVLRALRASEPFSALPREERRHMENLQAAVEANEIARASAILNQLKEVLATRYQEYQKIDEQNRRAIPLAIVSLVLTIAFGTLSVVLGLRIRRKTAQS